MKFIRISLLALMLGTPVLDAQELASISDQQRATIVTGKVITETAEYPTPSKNLEEKWGYVNEAGQYVIQPQYDYACEFLNGFALVMVGRKYGYIKKDGSTVFEPIFDDAYPVNEEGRTIVKAGRVTFLLEMETMTFTVW